MFSLVTGIYDAYLAPTKLNLLVVGGEGVGKTALLERLKVTQFTKNKKVANNKQHNSFEEPERDVPEAFLPLLAREKLLHNSSSIRSLHSSQEFLQTPATTKKKKTKKSKQKKDDQPKEGESNHNNPPQQQRRSLLSCPAPSRYSNAREESSSSSDDSSGDEGGEESNSHADDEHDDNTPALPERNGMGNGVTSQDLSLEDVSLVNDKSEAKLSKPKPAAEESAQNGNVSDSEEEDQEYDLKSASRMLPLHKIRPTIGMNLGKVEICSAQCHVWDLGGKMHDLWSRYYADCDAVVFVWKIIDDSDPLTQMVSEKNDDDSDDGIPPITAAEQLVLLEQVRDSIPDDVPFLIWGHWFPHPSVPKKQQKKPKVYQYDEAHSTSSLLPHYHNPLMKVYFGSSKSGAGVRTAMEWLIPNAARQKKLRTPTTVEK